MNKIIAFIVAFALIISCSIAQTITEKEIKVSGYGEKKLKKAPKKVYIANFKVYFHVIASGSAKSTGGTSFGGGSIKGNTSTSMTVAVQGVDIEDFQKITDDTYNRFAADLVSKGFEIINAEEASKIDFYSDWEMKQGGEVNYANVPGYVSVTPTGTKYLVKKETRSGREKKTFIDRTPRISKELDDAIIIEATFAFPFIEMKTNSSSLVGFSSVKAKTDFALGTAAGSDGLTNLQEYTRVKFTSGSGPGASANAYMTADLKKEFDIDGVFKEDKFREFSAAKSTSLYNATPNYFGVVFAENRTNNVTNLAECDGEKYIQATTNVINNYMDLTLTEFYENAIK